MARSSRHKLHRSHKHRDRSESDGEDISKERKPKTEEEDTVRTSRVSDQEKRRNSSKDVVLASNGDVTSEHGKRRKDIGDRWNGGGEKEVKIEKTIKGDEIVVKSEKSSKGKYVSSVSKNRDEMSEKREEKRRTDKESGSSFPKDGKEMEKAREREKLNGKEMEKKERGTNHEVEASEDMHSREVEKERSCKRKNESGDYDKVDDSREDSSKYKSHKDGRSKEKYRDELDREYRHHDDKRRRDERSSRTHTSEKSDKYYRDETKVSESHDKKSKFQESEYDGSRYSDNHISKHKDSRGRKRPSDEIGDQNDTKIRSTKEPRDDTLKYGSSSSRYDARSDRAKVEQSDMEKADSSLGSIRPKHSPKSVYDARDHKWEKSGKTESTQRESISVDVHPSSSVVRERMSEVKSSDKGKLMAEADRTPLSDSRTSLNHLSEKPSFVNERQPEDGGQKSNNAPSPNTSNHLPPPLPPNKFSSPSVIRSYEDEMRNQNSDRRMNSRYKRGPGTPWKGPVPAWPSPVVNGFMPMQHGPPLGFPHPTVPQFPPFGVRPSLDMISSPYNNLHVHPYDMQMWDGNPNMFEEPHMFGRQEWDQNRAMMGNRGWNVQNGSMNMEYGIATQKENDYSHDEHLKSEKLVADDGGSKASKDESPVKKEVGQLSKFKAEKIPEPSKMPSSQKTSETKTNNHVNYVHCYISKLDVSPGLVSPDVYNQFTSLLEAKDGKSTSHHVSMGQRKNNLNGFMPVTKSRHSLLPKPSDDIFQKAMSLYSMKMVASKTFKSKVEGHMNESKRAITTDAQAVNDTVEAHAENLEERADNNNNDTDENYDVEVSEKTENVVNPESFGVDISRILSTESTH